MSENMIDPWQLTPPRQREETVEVIDPEQPGTTYVVRLKQLTIPESLAAQSAAEELVAEFIDGLDGDEPNAYPAPVPFRPSRKLFENAAFLAAMEQGPVRSRLGVRGFIGIAIMMPTGFTRLTRSATRLNQHIHAPPPEDPEGNSHRKGRGSSSSAPPSGSTSATPA
jgi:hypothetical protein